MSIYSIKTKYEVPACNCGLHMTSRMRIGMINDIDRQKKFSQVLSNVVSSDSVVMNLSECSMLGHYVALLGAQKVKKKRSPLNI